MVQIPKRAKPRIPFLKGHNVEDGDLATIIEPPYIQSAEKSQFGRERTIITVKLRRTEEIFRFGLNTQSNDRLVEAFTGEGNLWKDKEIKILKRQEVVLGQDRDVLYAIPSIQTQFSPHSELDDRPSVDEAKPEQTKLVKDELLQSIAKMSPEWKAQLLEILQKKDE